MTLFQLMALDNGKHDVTTVLLEGIYVVVRGLTISVLGKVCLIIIAIVVDTAVSSRTSS